MLIHIYTLICQARIPLGRDKLLVEEKLQSWWLQQRIEKYNRSRERARTVYNT